MNYELVGHKKKLRILHRQVRDVNFGLAQLYSDRRGFSTSYASSALTTYVGGLTVRPTVRCTYLNHRRQTETTPAATDWRAFCFSPTSVTYKNPVFKNGTATTRLAFPYRRLGYVSALSDVFAGLFVGDPHPLLGSHVDA